MNDINEEAPMAFWPLAAIFIVFLEINHFLTTVLAVSSSKGLSQPAAAGTPLISSANITNPCAMSRECLFLQLLEISDCIVGCLWLEVLIEEKRIVAGAQP